MENSKNTDLNLDALRNQTLIQIKQTVRWRKRLIWAVAVVEAVVIWLFVWLADFSDGTHLLIFIAVLGIWGIFGLALMVLGSLQRENTLRILNAIQSLKKD